MYLQLYMSMCCILEERPHPQLQFLRPSCSLLLPETREEQDDQQEQVINMSTFCNSEQTVYGAFSQLSLRL